MPLAKGSSRKICHKNGNPYDLFSFDRISPMLKSMAIGTNCLKIFNVIIFSVFIFVMNLQHKLIFNLTSFATNFVKFFVCLRKTFNNIVLCAKGSFVDRRTFSRTISTKPLIHFIAARHHYSAPYTRITLCTFNGAIFSFATKFVRSKFHVASFAYSHFIFCLVRTCSRTTFLFNTTFAVVQLKCCIANKAVAHGGQYATS